MSRVSIVALLAGCLACSTGPDEVPLHTVFLQYDRTPTAQDESTIRANGGTDLTVIPIAQAITLRTSAPATRYRTLPGVAQSVDMGPDADPLRSISILVVDEATAADTSYVRAAGAQTVGIIPPNWVAALMNLGSVSSLGDNPRFVSVTVEIDDLKPQP